MNNVTRRDPSSALDRTGEMESTSSEQFVLPRASVFESKDSVVLELEMPGVARDGVDVTVEKDELTIIGKRRPTDYSGCEVYQRERLPFDFKRSFVLSDVIDTGKISAQFDNGVLKLTLDKSDLLKPKKITIT